MLNNAASFCLIVDPYVTSHSICDALLKQNIAAIGLVTGRVSFQSHEAHLHFDPKKFEAVFTLQEWQEEALIAHLRQFPINYVIAGNETSLDICDSFAKKLSPQTANDPLTSCLRMNKFAMNEALHKAGIAAVQHLEISPLELTEEMQSTLSSWSFPLILKPSSQGGASSFVSRCGDIDDLQCKLQNMKQANTVSSAVAQEYLTGVEYYINTVSWQGQHVVISVHRYHKTLFQGRPTYRYAEIVDPKTAEAVLGIDYVKHVLDTVDLRFGFAHTEIFLTSKGPYLVEVNPRLSGSHGYGNKLAHYTVGYTQAEVLAQTLNNPNYFSHLLQSPITSLKQHGRVVYLQNWQQRIIRAPNTKIFCDLPSYKEHLFLKQSDQMAEAPIDLCSTTMLMLLTHEDPAQIQQDYAYLLDCEAQELLF
ncbi:hypothetical protein BH10PSE19_BH10PSE19_21210 [soil metagenome]